MNHGRIRSPLSKGSFGNPPLKKGDKGGFLISSVSVFELFGRASRSPSAFGGLSAGWFVQ